ncbi:MAG: glycosyltransferase family 39 protein [Bdellovibrionota bacterium]
MPHIDRTNADKTFTVLILLLTALQVLCVVESPLALAPDEAHYWEWSRRLDFSYYSKGPLVAYLIYFSRLLFGDTSLGVRFPAILSLALFSSAYYFFVRRFYAPGLALLAFIAVRSILIFAQMGLIMTTDGPAALCWMIALLSAYFAVVDDRRHAWLPFGFFIGIGILAKYTLIFLFVSVALFLVLTPRLRSHLRCWQFITGTACMFICTLPILIWNSKHDWVNFSHNASHVVRESGVMFSPKYLPELLLGQMGLVGPIVFYGLIYALIRGYRVWRKGDITAGLFFFSCAPLGIFVVVISLTKRVYANWPLPFYVGAILLFVHLLSLRAIGNGRTKTWMQAGIALSALITIFAHLPFLGFTLGLPANILPSKRLAGWQFLAKKVDAEVQKSLSKKRGMPFVLAEDYEILSEVAFYSTPRPETLSVNLDDRRMNQYDIWGGFERVLGRDALVIMKVPEKVEKLRPHFKSLVEVDGSPVTSSFADSSTQPLYIYRGEGYDGWIPPLPTKR